MIPSNKTPLQEREENTIKDLEDLMKDIPDERLGDFKKITKARELLKESGFNYWLIPFFPKDGEEFYQARVFNSYDNFTKFNNENELTDESRLDVICFNTSFLKIVIKSFFPEFLDPNVDNSKKFVEFARLMKMISDE